MKDKARSLLRLALDDPQADFRLRQWACIKPFLQRKRMCILNLVRKTLGIAYFGFFSFLRLVACLTKFPAKSDLIRKEVGGYVAGDIKSGAGFETKNVYSIN